MKRLNSYFQSKIVEAGILNKNLRNTIHELLNLSYQKGSREDDYIIRDSINEILNELENYDNMLRAFDAVKIGDKTVCETILAYFIDNFLYNNKITKNNQSLQKIVDEIQADENTSTKNDEQNRILNLFANELFATFHIWQKTYRNDLRESLIVFIHILNELYCYLSIADILKKTKDDSSETIIIKHFHHFLKIYILSSKVLPADNELKDVCYKLMNQMGFENILFDGQLISEKKLLKMIKELPHEIPNSVKANKKELTNKVKSLVTEIGEKSNSIKSVAEEDLKKFQKFQRNFNKLCNIENEKSNYQTSQIEKYLAKNKNERFLFIKVGEYSTSLSCIIDTFSKILITINKWILQEVKKNTQSLSMFKSFLECNELCFEFIQLYCISYITSQGAGNILKSEVFLSEKKYISKKIAQKLAQHIEVYGEKLKECFTLSNLEITSNEKYSKSAIHKRLIIVQEDYLKNNIMINKRIAKRFKK